MSSTSFSAQLKTLADTYSWPTINFSCFFAGVAMLVVSNIKTPHTWEWDLFLAASIVLMLVPLFAVVILWFMMRRNCSDNLIDAAEVWLMWIVFLICFSIALLIICTASITLTGWHLPTVLTIGCLLMFLPGFAAFCSILGYWGTFLHNNMRPILFLSSIIAGIVMAIVCGIKTPHTWEWAVFLAASVVLIATPLMIVLVFIVLDHMNKLTEAIHFWLEVLIFFVCILMPLLIVCVAAFTTIGWRLPTIIIVGCLLMVITVLLAYFSLVLG